jgi:cardiolipin synthase
MQAVFMDNWTKATGKVLSTAANLFPALAAVGDPPAQMFSSSPSGGSESMHLMYLLAITAADAHDPSVRAHTSFPDELAFERPGGRR